MEQIIRGSHAHDVKPLLNASVYVIVENERGEILLQWCSYTEQWRLPGGVKEPNQSNEQIALQDLKDETGLHLAQFSLYRMFSRTDFTSYYSEGDEVFQNMNIYMAKSYFGYLKTRGMGSDKLRFFSLYDLPSDFHENSKLIVDAYAADHFWIGG